MNALAWLWRKLFPPQPPPTIEQIEDDPVIGSILKIGESAGGEYSPYAAKPENSSQLCTGEHR